MSGEAPAAVTGLDPSQAATRLRDEGPNELGLSQRRTLRDIAWEVLREPMFVLLLGAGAIYLATGDTREALILLGFVFIIMGACPPIALRFIVRCVQKNGETLSLHL